MSEPTICRACERETRDEAYMCDSCHDHLARALGNMTWLDAALENTITRQKGATIGSGARGTETPLPWHEKASEARRTLHSLLVWWVQFCEAEKVRGLPRWEAADDLTSLGRWLLNCARGLTFHEEGTSALDEITDAVAQCERIVFWKKRSRSYLGQCGQTVTDEEGEVVTLSCEGDVYAEEDEQVGNCDDCGQGVTVVIRKAELEALLDDRLCTASDIARMAVFLGLDVPRDSVRKKVHYWHRHKRIIQRGTEPESESPMFRYGEVKALLYGEFGRASA